MVMVRFLGYCQILCKLKIRAPRQRYKLLPDPYRGGLFALSRILQRNDTLPYLLSKGWKIKLQRTQDLFSKKTNPRIGQAFSCQPSTSIFLTIEQDIPNPFNGFVLQASANTRTGTLDGWKREKVVLGDRDIWLSELQQIYRKLEPSRRKGPFDEKGRKHSIMIKLSAWTLESDRRVFILR